MRFKKKRWGMFSLAICDDDELLCEKFESYIDDYIRRGIVHCEVYYSGEKLYDDMASGKWFDLVFLDIELKKIGGIELGHRIRDEFRNEKTHIVYISAKSDYAMDLFAVRPMDFLVKPVEKRAVIKSLKKAMQLSCYYDQYMKFQKGGKLYSISYGDIMYFCINGRKTEVHAVNDIYDFYGKLDDIQSKTPPDFIRIHKSYLVNIVYVSKWEYETVTLADGTCLSISSRYRKSVREELMKRWEGE